MSVKTISPSSDWLRWASVAWGNGAGAVDGAA
jgi:hypothetical protein